MLVTQPAKRLVLIWCLLLTTFLLHAYQPNRAHAQGLFTLDPAFQEVVLLENQSKAQAVISYKNDSNTVREVELFAYDFTQNDVLGGVAFVLDNQSYPHSLASFLQLNKNRLVLAPGETQHITITVDNRSSLSPGGHYAAVIARDVGDPTDKAKQPVVPALSSLILVRKVGGERFHLSLAGVDWQPKMVVSRLPTEVELTLQNDGNVHDIPRGTMTVTGLGNRTLLQGTVNEESLYVLPGTLRKITVRLHTTQLSLPIDFVTITLQGSGQYSNITYAWQESALLVSWYVPLILVALCGVVAVFLYLRQRKNHHAQKNI